MSKVYAAILAGGSGTRAGNPDRPKQFWDLGSKPVIAHTVEKFCLVPQIDEVICLVPQSWVAPTQDIVSRHLPQFASRISVIEGGADRNATIQAALAAIAKEDSLEGSIILTHDAVRPFVSLRIIEENIAAAREHGACDTVSPATDTIVMSDDDAFISSIPERGKCYQGQTPQSFDAALLKETLDSLEEDEREVLTDACKALVLRGRKIALVKGDASNIKLTYPEDFRIAKALMGQEDA